jgi:hypothetical protein
MTEICRSKTASRSNSPPVLPAGAGLDIERRIYAHVHLERTLGLLPG